MRHLDANVLGEKKRVGGMKPVTSCAPVVECQEAGEPAALRSPLRNKGQRCHVIRSHLSSHAHRQTQSPAQPLRPFRQGHSKLIQQGSLLQAYLVQMRAQTRVMTKEARKRILQGRMKPKQERQKGQYTDQLR